MVDIHDNKKNMSLFPELRIIDVTCYIRRHLFNIYIDICLWKGKNSITLNATINR